MKTLWIRTLLIVNLVSSVGIFFNGCSVSDSSGASSSPTVITGVLIHNRSQFEIEHLFIYPPTRTYQESENLITSNLELNELIYHQLPAGEYLVTVTRRQNATGDLLAYTMTEPVFLDKPMVIEYYDTEFRVYDLKLTIPTETVGIDDNDTKPTTQKQLLLSSGISISAYESFFEEID